MPESFTMAGSAKKQLVCHVWGAERKLSDPHSSGSNDLKARTGQYINRAD